MDTAITSLSPASTLTAVEDEVNCAEIAADEEEVDCPVANVIDAAEGLDTAIASPSPASTLSADANETNDEYISANEEEELKSVC